MKKERSARVRYYFEIRGLVDGSGESAKVRLNRHQSRPERIETMQLAVPFTRYARFIELLEAQAKMRFLGTYPEYVVKTRLLSSMLREYATANSHIAECFVTRSRRPEGRIAVASPRSVRSNRVAS